MTSRPEMLASDQASHSDAADPLHLEFDAKDSEALVKLTGTMKWFDATRGFGFLVSDQAKGDILVHFSVLKEHRSEEHTSKLQSLMRISNAVFCLKKQKKNKSR